MVHCFAGSSVQGKQVTKQFLAIQGVGMSTVCCTALSTFRLKRHVPFISCCFLLWTLLSWRCTWLSWQWKIPPAFCNGVWAATVDGDLLWVRFHFVQSLASIFIDMSCCHAYCVLLSRNMACMIDADPYPDYLTFYMFASYAYLIGYPWY